MNTRKLSLVVAPLAVAGLVAAGCGGRSSSHGSAQPAASTGSASGVLAAEANSAAAGDIPDNQAFVTLTNTAAGYSMQYPEGWAQQGSGGDVTFRDKNNLVHVVVSAGGLPSAAQVSAQLDTLTTQTPSLTFDAPTSVTVHDAPAIKVVYSTKSAPSPVTGNRVTLVVDRYYLAGPAKLAVVDLATPRGVDNVDAYRQMIESFRWK